MYIEILPSGPFETNSYVIACDESKNAAIIDPGVESYQKIVGCIERENLSPVSILLTHSHWDHIADVAKLKRRFSLDVMIHKDDAENLISPGSDGLPLWVPIEGVEPDTFLEEGNVVEVGKLSFRVIHTPGHTPGGICFYSEKEKLLFSGDTLFKRSIGNISFPTASPDDMWQSLKKLEILPPETVVYPGHGPITTIGEESWLPRAKEVFS